MRLRTPVVAWAALLLASAFLGARTASAEDPPRSKPRGSDGFRFTPPDEGKPEPGPGKASPTKAPAGPVDPLEVAIRGLSTWPGQDGIKAAETLLLAGPASVDHLMRALVSGDPAVRPGAAWVLGKVGGREHVQVICTAAAERTSGNRLEVFFEAAAGLDAALAKKWLFSYLFLRRPTFRARASEFLAGIVTPEDRPTIENLLSSKDSGVRVAGYELLARLKAPDAVDRLVEALPDPHPDVARRASQLLSQGDAAVLARLNGLARDGDSRQRAYATLALADASRRLRRSVFEPATLPALASRRGLTHPDKLSRGAAAVGLAFGALDVEDPALSALLDRDVVDVLVDTVSGDHFLDYAGLVEPVFAALRRLSGLDLSSTSGPWVQWWAENRGKFRARRTLTAVSKADQVHARVVFDAVDGEGRRRRAAFVPEGGDPVENAFVLPLPAFEALVGGVEDAGIFTGADDSRQLSDESLAVRVGVLNQERRLVLVPSRDDARFATLSARLEALEEQNLWQRYPEPGWSKDPAGWRRRQGERYASLDPATRRAALVEAIVSSFGTLLGDGARSEALDTIARLGVAPTDAQAERLLAAATGSRAIGPVEARVVEMVAALERPGLAEALVEALSLSSAPAATRLLRKTLAEAGPERLREAFADTRPGVRAAGAAAAADLFAGPGARDPTARGRLAGMLQGGLKALVVDPDPVVVARAAGALAMLGEPDMVEKLEAVYRDGEIPVKIAVAESLGLVGGSAAHPLLVRIVGEQGEGTAPVRAAALEAMARDSDPNSVHILAHYMLTDADAGVQHAAETALTELATDQARFVLVEMLGTGTLEPSKTARVLRALATFDGPVVRETLGRFLESPSDAVVDQAALGLARQNEGVAVPYLVALLRRPEEPLRPRAVEALQDLTCVTLVVTGYDAVADQVEAWYRVHKDGGDRAWFRDALEKKGYDGGALLGYVVKGELDPRAVPVLLRALRDDDPTLRRGAAIALQRSTGRGYGAVGRGTPKDQVVRVADRWSQWWATSPSNPASGRR